MASLADPTLDQELLRSSTARFVEASSPVTKVRSLIGDERGFHADYLEKGAQLGWLAMLVPEEFGGGSVSQRPLADLALVVQERGRSLQPGPVVVSNVVASAVAESGSHEQRATHLPALATGHSIATWALADEFGNWSPAGAVASPAEDGYALRGGKHLVPDAHVADLLLVTAALVPNGEPVQFLIPTNTPGVTITSLETMDLTRRLAHVDFQDVVVPAGARLGTGTDSTAAIERQLQVAVALSVAETVGTMDRLFEFTLQYAKDRVAFGRPIGSFQAVKHLLADLSLLLEASKAGERAAIDAVQDRDPAAGEVVSLVKSFISDSAVELSQGCLQIHGGIGYTWEHDLHLYYRRLAGDRVLFGDPVWHRERVCTLHGL